VKTIKNFIYNSAYQILALLIPLITTPYLSRTIGPGGIGEYSYAYSIAYFFSMFIILGLNNYGSRTIAILQNNKEKLSKNFCSIYTMQLFCGLIGISAYVLYSLTLSHNRMISFILLAYIISEILDINWFFFGIEKFKLTVVRNSVIKLLSTLSIFLFVNSKEDVYIYSFIMAFSFLISQLAIWPFLTKEIKFIRPSLKEVLTHIKPNLILFIPIIAVSIYKYMDKIMLGSLTNVAEVGFFDSAERLINVPIALVNALGVIMIPRMSNIVALNNKIEGQRIIYISILFVLFLSSSLSFGIMGTADLFVPLFFGEGFEKCIILLLILLPSCLFLAFANVIRTQYLIPMRKDNIYIISVFVGALVNLIINGLLIPIFQSAGSAIGTLCAEISVCSLQAFFVRRELPIGKYIKISMPFIISGIIMFLIINGIQLPIQSRLILLITKICIGIMVYFISLGIQFYVFKDNYQYLIELTKRMLVPKK